MASYCTCSTVGNFALRAATAAVVLGLMIVSFLNVVAHRQLAADGTETTLTFPVTVRIDTPVELDYYRNGGILHTVTRKLLKG